MLPLFVRVPPDIIWFILPPPVILKSPLLTMLPADISNVTVTRLQQKGGLLVQLIVPLLVSVVERTPTLALAALPIVRVVNDAIFIAPPLIEPRSQFMPAVIFFMAVPE